MAAILLLWELVSISGLVPSYMLPSPVAVCKALIGDLPTILFHMTFSMTLNFIAIVLAITGILNPIVGALVHNAGSVLVITNSAFLLKWRKK